MNAYKMLLQRRPCSNCAGEGKLVSSTSFRSMHSGQWAERTERPCPVCDGSGLHTASDRLDREGY